MKKTVHVVIEKEYEIEIDNESCTQQAIDEFEFYMFELEGESLQFKRDRLFELEGESLQFKRDRLFEYAASQIARYEVDFVEGIGKCSSVRTAPFHENEGKKVYVVWDDKMDETVAEVVN